MFKGEDRPIRLHTNLNIVAETGGCLQSSYQTPTQSQKSPLASHLQHWQRVSYLKFCK